MSTEELIGKQIGVYKVVSLLGAGGMGEVYRARDTKLARDVAIKVLPSDFAFDPERLARFQREARVLASLNHPHIGAIHGFEESDGIAALVLELVEGPTLAERILNGPVSMGDALKIARQIAEALDAAHEKGIIHRDLKPANIKLTADGQVKVLDFGLAKLAHSSNQSSDQVTETLATREGAIFGTPAYMSPEQARGLPVDKRTDIWAFGCVLYEILTQREAFPGNTLSDRIVAIIEREPDWSVLPAAVPAGVRHLLRRCLDKDPARRLRDIGDARFDMESDIPAVSARQSPARVVSAAIASLVIGALLAGVSVWFVTRSRPARVTRLSILPPADAPLTSSGLAITADGTKIIYVSANGRQLSVRAVDAIAPLHLTNLGTSISHPFISPDGQWIGFFEGLNALKKVPMTGGPAVSICSLAGAAGRGATWLEDGTIIFATDDPATGLLRVSANGGTPEEITKATGQSRPGDHLWPHALPDGRAVLFTFNPVAGNSRGQSQVAVLDLESRDHKLLMPGSRPQYVATGHVLYGADNDSARVVRFDIASRTVIGTSVSVLNSVSMPRYGAMSLAVANDGTMVYVPGGPEQALSRLLWVDRAGKEEPIEAPPGPYTIPRLSPDGTRVALDHRAASGANIYLWHFLRKSMTRFTFGVDVYPVWTPDGRRVAFTTFDGNTGVGNLFVRDADGATPPERLSVGARSRYASSFTPDGARLLFREETPSGLDVWMLHVNGERRAEPLLREPFNEMSPEVSPDGKWLAYVSNESGRDEVYVRPFPDVTSGLWQISNSGGVHPAWAPNGRELFYLAQDGTLMTVPINPKPPFSADTPAKLLPPRYLFAGPYRTYDVSRDGNRFLRLIEDGSEVWKSPSIVVVQNWFDELKRMAGAAHE